MASVKETASAACWRYTLQNPHVTNFIVEKSEQFLVEAMFLCRRAGNS